jgi:hypothetical protein
VRGISQPQRKGNLRDFHPSISRAITPCHRRVAKDQVFQSNSCFSAGTNCDSDNVFLHGGYINHISRDVDFCPSSDIDIPISPSLHLLARALHLLAQFLNHLAQFLRLLASAFHPLPQSCHLDTLPISSSSSQAFRLLVQSLPFLAQALHPLAQAIDVSGNLPPPCFCYACCRICRSNCLFMYRVWFACKMPWWNRTPPYSN